MNELNSTKIENQQDKIQMQKINPFLWFENQSEDAAKFYVSVFKNAKINTITRYEKEGYEIHKMKEGTVMMVDFEIPRSKIYSNLNGGPMFKFNESISFQVNCATQQEVDYYWEKLSEGGDKKAQQCGSLKDKYGLSWQIVPIIWSR